MRKASDIGTGNGVSGRGVPFSFEAGLDQAKVSGENCQSCTSRSPKASSTFFVGLPTDGKKASTTKARALERRGLVKVQGRGRSWTATLTAGGRYYIDHGEYEASPGPGPELDGHQRTRTARPTPKLAPIDYLVGRLRAAAGVLRLNARLTLIACATGWLSKMRGQLARSPSTSC